MCVCVCVCVCATDSVLVGVLYLCVFVCLSVCVYAELELAEISEKYGYIAKVYIHVVNTNYKLSALIKTVFPLFRGCAPDI